MCQTEQRQRSRLTRKANSPAAYITIRGTRQSLKSRQSDQQYYCIITSISIDLTHTYTYTKRERKRGVHRQTVTTVRRTRKFNNGLPAECRYIIAPVINSNYIVGQNQYALLRDYVTIAGGHSAGIRGQMLRPCGRLCRRRERVPS